MSVTTTLTPSAASVLAMARPMPRPAPVTIAVLPLRSISISYHRARQRLAGEMRLEIGDDERPHLVAGLVRGAALVRRQHDVVEPEQSLGHLRLLVEDIERRTAEFSRHQHLDQRRLV